MLGEDRNTDKEAKKILRQQGEGGQRGFGWKSERRELENNIEADDRLTPAESLDSIRVNCWENIIILLFVLVIWGVLNSR